MAAAWQESCVDERAPAGRCLQGSGGAEQPSQAAILGGCLHAEDVLGVSQGCWPVRSTAVHFLHKRSSPLAPKALFPESTVGLVSASVLLPVSKFSGPEDSPVSLLLSLSLCLRWRFC